jgi:hypothetical protein
MKDKSCTTTFHGKQIQHVDHPKYLRGEGSRVALAKINLIRKLTGIKNGLDALLVLIQL